MRFHRFRDWAAVFALQLGIVTFSFWTAWFLRFDFIIPQLEYNSAVTGFVLDLIAKLLVFFCMRQHLEHWLGYQGFSELTRLLRLNVAASALSAVLIFVVIGFEYPRSIYLLDLFVSILASGGARFGMRLRHELRAEWRSRTQRGLLIYGAGVAGITLAREIRANPALGYRVLGFIDDDERKVGRRMIGLPVLGTGKQITDVLSSHTARGIEIQEIVVAMPSATGRRIREAQKRGAAAGVRTRIVPGLGELISGKLAVRSMREISVTDLLGRDPVELDLEKVRRAIAGRNVLVTGAAGSIGTELCHQIAQLSPSLLVAFDQAESELFRLEHDLQALFPRLNLMCEVGDIRDPLQVEHTMVHNTINSVFHAAAYKHVPLMQRQVCEAVRNNVIGTWNLAQAAWRANVSDFLLISSDKAVNPTSIMGMTKRVAELVVSAQRSALAGGAPTRFVCVRFGNVLVSNGSVVPTFQKQIAAGGPVTVTHPEMRRYFMTVQEAVQLVLQSSTLGRGSEVFVLDMGEPVKIVDLATNMITLAGFTPGEDIEIQFVGLRPGEKTFEEISLASEHIAPTAHPKIKVFQGRQLGFRELSVWIAELQHLLWRRDPNAVIEHLKILVPEFQDTFTVPAPAVAHADEQQHTTAAPLSEAFKSAAG